MLFIQCFGKSVIVDDETIGYIDDNVIYIRGKKVMDMSDEGILSIKDIEVGYIGDDGSIIINKKEVGYLDPDFNMVFYSSFLSKNF